MALGGHMILTFEDFVNNLLLRPISSWRHYSSIDFHLASTSRFRDTRPSNGISGYRLVCPPPPPRVSFTRFKIPRAAWTTTQPARTRNLRALFVPHPSGRRGLSWPGRGRVRARRSTWMEEAREAARQKGAGAEAAAAAAAPFY